LNGGVGFQDAGSGAAGQLRKGLVIEIGLGVGMLGTGLRWWQHEHVLLVVVGLLETVGVVAEQREVLEKNVLRKLAKRVHLGTVLESYVQLESVGEELEQMVQASCGHYLALGRQEEYASEVEDHEVGRLDRDGLGGPELVDQLGEA